MKHVDPAQRRARNVVLLVIFGVALPSLLLTGLGIIAMRNEEASARKRLETLYEPVVMDLARKFNARADALVKESAEPLVELARWGRGEVAQPDEELLQFAQSTEFATNYFVVDAAGQALSAGLTGADRESLSGKLADALRQEKEREEKEEACRSLRELIGQGKESGTDSTLARYALGLCLKSHGLAEGTKILAETFGGSARLAGSPAALAGASLAEAASQREKDPQRFLDGAGDLAKLLGDPALPTPTALAELLARFFDAYLHQRQDDLPTVAQEKLEAIAERGALVSFMARFADLESETPQIQTVRVNGWRRVVVSYSREGVATGYELVAAGFGPFLTRTLRDLSSSAPICAVMEPIETPPCYSKEEVAAREKKMEKGRIKDRIAAWVLLKKTETAWILCVLLDDEKALSRLVHSRSRFYLWGLILIVSALVVGIAYTVRSVIQEARFSRLKTDFVSSVSHDLRTPLTSIRMFTETLLLGRVKDREQERDCLQVIARETERLTRLTERILDFSRMEAGRKAYAYRPESVADLVDQALAACRPLMEEAGCKTQVEIPESLPKVEVDRDAIVEVLVNLLSNAIKYSPDEREVRIQARRNHSFVEVSVADRGIGIPKSEQKRIFEKFYRVDCRRTSEVGGSGLGLSLVRYILEAHRGEVTVESTVGQGSTFTIHVPIEAGGRKGEPRGERRNGDHPGRRG